MIKIDLSEDEIKVFGDILNTIDVTKLENTEKSVLLKVCNATLKAKPKKRIMSSYRHDLS